MNLLYRTKYFATYQCDLKRCFCIDFGHKSVHLSLCQLLALRNKINSINLDTHFNPEINPSGIEILTLCNREHLFILDTHQVIDLKELMKNTFGVLELNTMMPLLA